MMNAREKFKDFKFIAPGVLVDDDLELRVKETSPYNPENDFVPQYKFEMVNSRAKKIMGIIDLRVGLTEKLKEFGGHIGYEVDKPFRGNNYAARSCKLLFPLIRQLGINPIVITCDPENIPSVRTIEALGGTLQRTKEVEIEPKVYRMTNIYYLYI